MVIAEIKKYGFIYIWFDRYRNMYYIGRHWGFEDDGYICSSNRMRDAYRRRPQDFKRCIIETNISKELLIEREQYWLNMIKYEEMGKKYYNLTKYASKLTKKEAYGFTILPGEWQAEETKVKISASHKGKKLSAETKEKIRQIRTGTKASAETIEKHRIATTRLHQEGKIATTEARNKMSHAAKNRSAETRAKIAANSRRLVTEGRVGMLSKKHSAETKQKMSNIQKQLRKENPRAPYTEERKDKIAKKWLITTPSGEQQTVINLERFCRENNLNSSNMAGYGKSKNYFCVRLNT